VLRDEIARLASENRTLRAQALGSLPPRVPGPRDSTPEIDLAIYDALLQRLGNVAGVKCAVLADDVGSVVLGRGDLAENLAAFGAYIRDASGRTERLLPLEGVDEIEIRDTAGLILSTRALPQPSALSIVLLASADAAFVAAKKVIDERVRLRG
jgi:predicted regulator of Ras-like GTPase activity (Roadblock/LC7/MglB family)